MLGGMKMFGGVFVFGGIAATDVAAGETQPQVNPRVSHFETFFTALCLRFSRMDVVDVCADIGH
jgi:hypothetical protein